MTIRPFLTLLALAGGLAGCRAAAGPAPQAVVRFERTACYGPCPVDVLTIFPDGRLGYQGHENAPRAGTYTGRLRAAEWQALRQAFEAAHFFELAPAYTSAALDLPTYYLTYAANGRQHRVADYDEAPAALKALEAKLVLLIDTPQYWRLQQPSAKATR